MLPMAIVSLVNNAALLLALGVLYDLRGYRRARGSPLLRQAATGLILGGMCIVIMLIPWQFGQGVVFDTRSVLLSLSGLFFGTFPTLIAALVAAGFRLALGGAGGWTGVLVIFVSGAIGVIWRHVRARRVDQIRRAEFYLFGWVVHVAMLLCMFTLPKPLPSQVLPTITVPVLAIYPVATTLMGWLLRSRERRMRLEEALRARDAILEAISFGAQVFLQARRWEVEIQNTLSRLGQAVNVSRAYIFENHPGPNGEIFTSQRYEWRSEGIMPQIDNPDLQDFPMKANGFSRWVELLSTGRPVFGAVREFPAGERPVLEAQDILSLAVVPIFVSKQWWGFMGFDDCRSERRWNPMDMEALQTAATLLGAAFERQQAEEALRNSQRQYETLAEHSPVGIFRTDAHGKTTYVNPRWSEIAGLARQDALAKGWLQAVHPDDRERIVAGWQQAFTAGLPSSAEYRFVRPDGTVAWVMGYAIPETDDQGNVVGYVGTITDITERKRLEERLLQAQKMEEVGRLAGGIAHDFNNILTAITGYATFVVEALPAGDPMRSDVEEILRSAERAANLTRQLLAFSRRQIIEQRTINLNDLILNLDKMLRRLISEDIELVTLPGEGLWQVKADPGQIEQALVNLAVNARDAMPEGGKLILETANVTVDEEYVWRHPGAVPGDYVMLAITDTGVGMTDEVKAHLFEPFFTTKEPGKGTGLGLATVYGIVKQHGGNIYAYSEPGKGATFKIYLPAVEAEAERLPRADEHGLIPRGTETVLVAEDESMVRAIMVRALTEQGYRVLEATNGSQALRIAQEHEGPIHLLVTDVVMPQMGGKELSDRIAALRPGIKTLFVSGYTENTIVHGGVLERGIAFLQKPFTAAAICRKARQVLDMDQGGSCRPRRERRRVRRASQG